MEGAFDSITLCGYLDDKPIIESSLICQLSGLD